MEQRETDIGRHTDREREDQRKLQRGKNEKKTKEFRMPVRKKRKRQRKMRESK